MTKGKIFDKQGIHFYLTLKDNTISWDHFVHPQCKEGSLSSNRIGPPFFFTFILLFALYLSKRCCTSEFSLFGFRKVLSYLNSLKHLVSCSL